MNEIKWPKYQAITFDCDSHMEMMQNIASLYEFSIHNKNLDQLDEVLKEYQIFLISQHAVTDYHELIETIYQKQPNSIVIVIVDHINEQIMQYQIASYLFFYIDMSSNISQQISFHNLWKWLQEMVKIKGITTKTEDHIAIAGGLINFIKQVYVRDNFEYALSSNQIHILQILWKNKGEIVSRDTLMSVVWDQKVVSERIVDTNMVYLRKIFGEKGRKTKYLQTIFGQGYRLNDE